MYVSTIEKPHLVLERLKHKNRLELLDLEAFLLLLKEKAKDKTLLNALEGGNLDAKNLRTLKQLEEVVGA